MKFTESNYENAIIELFNEHLGYDHIKGVEVERDFSQPLHLELVRSSLGGINRDKSPQAIEEAIAKITSIDRGTLVSRNRMFSDFLQNGVEVNYFDGKDNVATIVRLIDFNLPLHNNFTIINQWTIEERSVRRPDVILFINGLPLVVMELKSPSRENADVSEAYCQLRNYMQEIPSLFV